MLENILILNMATETVASSTYTKLQRVPTCWQERDNKYQQRKSAVSKGFVIRIILNKEEDVNSERHMATLTDVATLRKKKKKN